MSSLDPHFSSRAHDWETPPEFFAALHDEFCFTLDAAASHENAKLPRYFTPEEDGLNRSWSGERVWCNPPYGREISRWIEKAAASDAELSVLLIPARTDTQAWHRHIFGRAEVRFVEGRVNFVSNHNNKPVRSRAPFPAAVVIFRKGKSDD